MEQTWRWFGPDDHVRSGTSARPGRPASSRRCTTSPTAWSGASRRSRRARPRSRRILARPALERGREPAGARVHQARRRRSRAAVRQLSPVAAQPRPLRRHDDLLQLHAGARLDAHGTRPSAAGRRHGAALQRARVRGLRLLHAASAPVPRRTIRRRCWRGRGPGSTGRPRATSASCSPTSWRGCPAPSTATTSPACGACSTATAR